MFFTSTSKKRSDSLADFLNFIDLSKNDYYYHFENVKQKDHEHQDHIHLLELGKLGHHEKARLATKIEQSRIERRKSKDAVEVLEPLVTYLEDEANKKAMNRLRQVLGDMRKREERQENRVYHKRCES